MECKNCRSPLSDSYNYCFNCGAKLIRNRLTFINLWSDFKERFLDYDNSFLLTFLHLFSRPAAVIEGYLNGLRKKYIGPLAYFGIALTLSGIQLFVTQKVAHRIDWDLFNQGVNPELTAKLIDVMFDFSSFLFVLFVPVFALAALWTFNRKGYYLSEHITSTVYLLGHWSITLFLPQLILLIVAPNYYMQISFPALLMMLGYAIYCLQRINKYKTGQLLLRTGLFTVLVFIGYVGILVFFYILLFATGTITVQDFEQP